jgi:hypothetical protein
MLLQFVRLYYSLSPIFYGFLVLFFVHALIVFLMSTCFNLSKCLKEHDYHVHNKVNKSACNKTVSYFLA